MTRHTQILVLDADAVLERLERLEAAVLRLQPQEPTAMPIKDYAAKVGKTTRTVNNWIASGRIKTVYENGQRKVLL